MSKTQHSHETPVSPKAEVNTLASELAARNQEDSDKVVLEDEEYQVWVEAPEEE